MKIDLTIPFTLDDFDFKVNKNLKILDNDAMDMGWLQQDIVFYCEALRKKWIETHADDYALAIADILPKSFKRPYTGR